MEDMNDANGMKVLMHLMELESSSGTMKSAQSNTLLQPLSILSSLNDKNNVAQIFDRLKALESQVVDEKFSFSAAFDSIAGKYTYNFDTDEFEKTELADQVVIEFPGLESDNTNTASITIDDFNVQQIADTTGDFWPSDLDNELPSSVTVDLKYNSESIAGASFTASYATNGMPTRVSITLWVDAFSFTTTATHSPYASASLRNTVKYNEDIIFETYVAASGNWSEQNLEDAELPDIINQANAHVIIMNLKVLGMVNVKGIFNGLASLQENVDQYTTELEFYEAMAEVINNNAKLVVIYRDEQKIVAKAEAYPYYDEDDMAYRMDMRFVFSDGSSVSAETYVQTELTNLYEEINLFIDQLNAEYDLGLGHVGPPSK
jgi:hypothetical protein